MMLNLVDGTKLRTESRRRYVVVNDYGHGPRVMYRTDVLGRAKTRASKLGYRYPDDNVATMAKGTKTRYAELKMSTAEYMDTMRKLDATRVPVAHVYDTNTGEVVL